jgi:hypothetical protein
VVAILGALFAVGDDWSSSGSVAFRLRAARERSVGLGLGLLGGLSAVADGVLLEWFPSQRAELGPFAGVLLVVGLFLQFQPVPFLSSAVLPTTRPPLSRVLVSQVFPSLAAFALLVRLEPQLRQAGVFPAFGWIALASLILSGGAGLLSPTRQGALSAWGTALFSAALCALSFSGVWSALAILASALAGLLVVCLAGPRGEGSVSAGRATLAIIALAAAVGGGSPGSAGAGGSVFAIAAILKVAPDAWMVPAAVSAALGFALLLLLGVRVAADVRMAPEEGRGGAWLGGALLVLFLLPSAAWLFLGTLSGGMIPGNPDKLGFSWLWQISGSEPPEVEIGVLTTAIAVRWVSWFAAAIFSIWVFRGGSTFWEKVRARFPRFSKFLGGGYVMPSISGRGAAGVISLGEFLDRFARHFLWEIIFTLSLGRAVRSVARAARWFDARLLQGIDGLARLAAGASTSAVRASQHGDVQGYVALALGIGLAYLLYQLIRGQS